MKNILDKKAGKALRGDQPQLHRLLTAVCRNHDAVSYGAAFEFLQRAAVDDPDATVRDALGAVGGLRLSQVEDDLRTLEQAAGAADGARRRVLRMLDAPATDQAGRVLLLDEGITVIDSRPAHLPGRQQPSAGDGALPRVTAASFATIMNAPLFSQRLHEARGLWPNRYDGEAGAKAWRQEDQLHAQAGIDALATAKLGRQVAAAQQAAGLVAAQLDQAFDVGQTPAARAKGVKQAIRQAKIMLDQMEAPAGGDRVPEDPAGWADRRMVLHNEVMRRRRKSGRGYMIELEQAIGEGL
jgi:hypothetical protein